MSKKTIVHVYYALRCEYMCFKMWPWYWRQTVVFVLLGVSLQFSIDNFNNRELNKSHDFNNLKSRIKYINK